MRERGRERERGWVLMVKARVVEGMDRIEMGCKRIGRE